MQPKYHTLTQFVLLIIIPKSPKGKTEASPCVINKTPDFTSANCRKLNLKNIPNDIDRDIASLDLSENPINYMKRSEFRRYKSLQEFVFNPPKNKTRCKIDPDTFADLDNLIILNLNGNELGSHVKLIFPKNLIWLLLKNTKQTSTSLDISYLCKLHTAYLENNELTEFPKIHENAPLKGLDLNGNSISTIPVEKLARYCELYYLAFNITGRKSMLNDPCQCPRLKNLTITRKLFGIIPPDFVCTPDRPCNEPIITPKMIKFYQKCKKNNTEEEEEEEDHEDGSSPFKIKFIIVTVIYVIMIASVVIAIYWGSPTNNPIPEQWQREIFAPPSTYFYSSVLAKIF